MAKRKTKGYYHTGEDSFDCPQIEYFEHDADVWPGFHHGPFKTYFDAQRDLEKMVCESIRNLQDLHDAVIKLRKKKGA